MNKYIVASSIGIIQGGRYDTIEEAKKQASLWSNDSPGKECAIYEILGSMKAEIVQAKFTEATKE